MALMQKTGATRRLVFLCRVDFPDDASLELQDLTSLNLPTVPSLDLPEA